MHWALSIDWMLPKINWVQELLEMKIFVVLKDEIWARKIWKWFQLLFMSLTRALYIRNFLFFFSLELRKKKTSRKRILIFFCQLGAFVSLQCIWRCFYSFNTQFQSTKEEEKSKRMKKWLDFENGIKIEMEFQWSKHSQNSIFLSIIWSTRQCLSFMTWRLLQWECLNYRWWICELSQSFGRCEIKIVVIEKKLSNGEL